MTDSVYLVRARWRRTPNPGDPNQQTEFISNVIVSQTNEGNRVWVTYTLFWMLSKLVGRDQSPKLIRLCARPAKIRGVLQYPGEVILFKQGTSTKKSTR